MNSWEHISQMKGNGKFFVVYGRTNAYPVKVILGALDICPKFVVDDDPKISGEMTDYGVVRTFDDIERPLDYNYIIIIDYMFAITRNLKEKGIPNGQIFCLNNWGSLGWDQFNDRSYMIDHWSDYLAMAERFDDEKSNEHYLAMCKFRMDYNPDRLDGIGINAYEQYLDPVMKFSDDECYVDVGAFDGRTVEKFAKHVGRRYRKIYAVEASESNLEMMKDRLKGGVANLEYLQYALMDKKRGIMHFDESGGSGAKLDDKGSLTVYTESLDNLIKDDMVTYVKMDIEGGEWDALHGMIGSIKRCRPKLAICIYHSSEDMLRIPRYMMKICDDYKFYVRQHGEGICETVCYGVPER